MGGPLSKLCVTPSFSINFRCQIENQVSDYRLLGASSFVKISLICIFLAKICKTFGVSAKPVTYIKPFIKIEVLFKFQLIWWDIVTYWLCRYDLFIVTTTMLDDSWDHQIQFWRREPKGESHNIASRFTWYNIKW